MSTRQYIGILVLSAFILIAVFGLYMPVHIGHETGCPFSPGETAMCASSLSHLEHWQSAFVAVLVQLLTLIAVAVVFFVLSKPFANRSPQYERYRLLERVPVRPPLFQELYSRGILNRKEPTDFRSELSFITNYEKINTDSNALRCASWRQYSLVALS